MNESMWWVFDGIVAVTLIIFAIITIKRGLIKAIVSTVGFGLSVLIAVTVSGSVAGSLYGSVVRASNVKAINKHIYEDTLQKSLAYELENSAYTISVNEYKLRDILEQSKNYDKDIYKFMNNINGKKVDDEEPFMENLHIAYSNVVKKLVSMELRTYISETAADKVLEDPSLFRQLIPLMLEKEDQRPAAVYICDNMLSDAYRTSFRQIILIALLGVCMVLSLILAQSAGRNDKIEPGFTRHLCCGLLGLFKGAAVVFAIAVIIRISVIYGSDKELMLSYPAIEKTYAFKYVYDFVCGLK